MELRNHMVIIERRNNMDFDDIYENYVIFEKESQMFIGIDSNQYRIAMREHAARFTKKDALEYISCGAFIEKSKHYVIQCAQ